MESAGSVWAGSAEALPPGIGPAVSPLLDRLASFLPHPEGSGRAGFAPFDAGPGQLGSPRIAQLAVLIALARRAAEAQRSFAWGVLQQPEAPLVAAALPEDLGRLMGARTSREATDGQLAAWRARLEDLGEDHELWIVGPPRLGPPPDLPGARHLLIRDTLDPAARRIGLALWQDGRAAGELLLEPPEDAVSVRLLRAAATSPYRVEEPAASPAAMPVEMEGDRDSFAPAPPEGASEPHRPRPAGFGARFATTLHRLTGRTALASRLSRSIGRRHVAYLRKLREMFESGDIDNALRHAIPLAVEAGPRRLPLRSFSPHAGLSSSPESS